VEFVNGDKSEKMNTQDTKLPSTAIDELIKLGEVGFESGKTYNITKFILR
jgi:hypothetical protein